MSAFSIFQASFDGGLRPQQRRKGLLAAVALTSGTVAVIGVGLLAVLHVHSNQLTDLANAAAPRDIRVTTPEKPHDKPCTEQTWPFMEGRCLIDTKSLRQAERALPRLALSRQAGSRDVAMVSPKKRARIKSHNGVVVIASRAKATQIASSTMGTAPRNENATQPAKPAVAAKANTPATHTTTSAGTPAPQKTGTAVVARRRPEQPRREARRREPLTHEQREARAEARSRRDEMRSASRWNDYGYPSSNGGGWQRGPFDGFFSTIR